MLVGLSILAAILILIFSLKHLEKLSLHSLFHKPSILYLACYGILIEFIAVCTRAVDVPEHRVFAALLFGLVYFIASFTITYYNSKTALNKLLLPFLLPGLILEAIAEINADLARGNTCYTLLYVPAILISVALESTLGSNKRRHNTMIAE